MTNEPMIAEVAGALRAAMENLAAAQLAGEGVPAAVEQLDEAIDAATAALNVPTPLDPVRIAAHNALVDEVNVAVDRFNAAAEALNATGAWCQFCGTTIEDGFEAVPTAVIPEASIQMYAHATPCHAMVMAASGSGAAR